MIVNVRYGSETYSRHYPDGSTVAQVLNDYDLKIQAGWGDNVRACVAGVEQTPNAMLPDGGTVVVETRANSKATS